MSRIAKRAARVKDKADLGKLLGEYGYGVVSDAHREQQFACDLHGPDNKPSARYYGLTNSFHCFACAKSRDVIAFVQDKEQIGFLKAIEHLERWLHLPALPWDEGDEDAGDPLNEFDREIEDLRHPTVTYEDVHRRVQKFLTVLTRDRDSDMKSLLRSWEAFDRVTYHVHEGHWDEQTGIVGLRTLFDQVLERLKTP